jgi:hypothetical protein
LGHNLLLLVISRSQSIMNAPYHTWMAYVSGVKDRYYFK